MKITVIGTSPPSTQPTDGKPRNPPSRESKIVHSTTRTGAQIQK